jgi:hypothetical protein
MDGFDRTGKPGASVTGVLSTSARWRRAVSHLTTNSQGLATSLYVTADGQTGTFTVSAASGSASAGPHLPYTLTNVSPPPPPPAVKMVYTPGAAPPATLTTAAPLGFEVDVEDSAPPPDLVPSDTSRVTATIRGPAFAASGLMLRQPVRSNGDHGRQRPGRRPDAPGERQARQLQRGRVRGRRRRRRHLHLDDRLAPRPAARCSQAWLPASPCRAGRAGSL